MNFSVVSFFLLSWFSLSGLCQEVARAKMELQEVQIKVHPIAPENRYVASTSVKMDSIEEHHRKIDLLRNFASANLAHQNIPEVRRAAAEMLQSYDCEMYRDWSTGRAFHYAHLVLGRVALREGEVNSAIDHLHLAAQTTGGPQLDTFGPNATLAKELLEKGERMAVIHYLEECLHFWVGDYATKSVAKWKSQIANGRLPGFGANLVY